MGDCSRLAASSVTVLGAPQGQRRVDRSWRPGCGQNAPASAMQGALGPPSPRQASKSCFSRCSSNCILKII